LVSHVRSGITVTPVVGTEFAGFNGDGN